MRTWISISFALVLLCGGCCEERNARPVEQTGCTIHKNCNYECDLEIHLVQIIGGSAVLTRNIITDGNRYGVFCADDAHLSFGCNDCWGRDQNDRGCPDPTGTEGNITADPRFADPAQDDCRLLPDSPCINAAACGRLGAFGPLSGG